MEEQAARWGGLGVCHVITQEGRPRPCQTGRAHLTAGLSFLDQRGYYQPSPELPTQLGSPACYAGDPGTALNLFNLSSALQLGWLL